MKDEDTRENALKTMNWFPTQLWGDLRKQNTCGCDSSTPADESQPLDSEESQSLTLTPPSLPSLGSLDSQGSDSLEIESSDRNVPGLDAPGSLDALGSDQEHVDDLDAPGAHKSAEKRLQSQVDVWRDKIAEIPGIKTVHWQQQHKRYRINLNSPGAAPIYETAFRIGRSKSLESLTDQQISEGLENACERAKCRVSPGDLDIRDMFG